MAEAFDSDVLKADMIKGYRQSNNLLGKSYFKGGTGMMSTAED